ncbi:hypothetical protein EDB92DRAFT_459854 [Lactarius akahatsu]|uniref:Uncharacterized protein n=1 Tax=Lactarius akahatsu TaxID=416441 RepID=A0AAD4LQ26_9AGAM|nr:hypothetical protein EDB92DRAFT_459854 [Lactarius akahatsu]
MRPLFGNISCIHRCLIRLVQFAVNWHGTLFGSTLSFAVLGSDRVRMSLFMLHVVLTLLLVSRLELGRQQRHSRELVSHERVSETFQTRNRTHNTT